MNCREISLILDDRDIERLAPHERAAVARHLADCTTCAAEWKAQERLLRRRLPPMPVGLRQRVWRALDQTRPAPARRSRVGRTGWVGGLLLVGAAAAMISTQPWRSGTEPAGSARTPSPRTAEPRTPDRAERIDVASDRLGAGRPDAAPVAELAARLQRRLSRGSCASDGNAAASPRLVVFPVQHRNRNPVAIAAVERFYDTFLLELGAVPGLFALPLTETDVARAEAAGASALCPDSPEQAIARYFGADRFVLIVDEPADHLEREHPDSWSLGFSFGGPSGTLVLVSSGDPTVDFAGYAKSWTDMLLSSLFEVPAGAAPSELEALVTDANALEPLRLEALRRLVRLGGDALSAPVIAAAVELATLAPEAETRLEVWLTIKPAANAAFVAPLLESLVYDPSDVVRRGAATAVSELVDDPAVREALERAAAYDASAEVRLRARWSLLDEEGRRELIVSALLDTTLPYEERLAPLRQNDGSTNADFVVMTIDGAARDALVEIAADAPDPEVRQHALNELSAGWAARLERPDVYLDRLRNDPDERVRSTAARILSGYVDLPEVRAALDVAGRGDPP